MARIAEDVLKIIYTIITLQVALLSQLPRCECGSQKQGFQLSGVYAGWLGHGNFGDELVLDIFGHLMVESLKVLASASPLSGTRVSLETQYGGILQVNADGDVVKARTPSIDFSEYDFAVLGGGSLLEPVPNSWNRFCDHAKSAELPIYLHATGTQVTSHSSRDTTSLMCLKQPSFGGLRGPITAARLHEMLALWASTHASQPSKEFNTRLRILADSGILAGRIFSRHAADVVGLVDKHRSPAGVICVSGMPRSAMRDSVRMVRVWASKYTVVLMPVDHVTYVKHQALLNHTLATRPSHKDRVFLNHHVTHYGVWLALLDRCDLLLTSRLHALIVGAATQTRFRVFNESKRRKLKMADFTLQTFGESVDRFLVRRSFRGSVAEIDQLLAEDDSRWRVRYNTSYEQDAIGVPYGRHLESIGKFLTHLAGGRELGGFSDIRVGILRYLDLAKINITFQ